MALGDLPSRDIATRHGVIRLWTAQATPVVGKPVVLAIGEPPTSMDELAKLASSLGFLADSHVMGAPDGFADAADAVRELIETSFPDRPVVLLGVSSAASLALAVRARNLARIVAVEPVLDGLGELIADLDLPVDVIVGSASPPPQPDGAETRRRIARSPRVRLHAAPDAGHDVLRASPLAVSRVVLEACRRAAAPGEHPASQLDETLLEATPIAANRLLYWGPHPAAFAAAFLSANPKAELDVAEPRASDYDAVVLGADPPPDLLARLTGALADEGHLVARWGQDTAVIAEALAPLGLKLREPLSEAEAGVVRAQKTSGGALPKPALHLQIVAYAETLMDVRTRLPARGLASDPALRVRYGGAPLQLPPLPPGMPKVIVLQRLAETKLEVWRATMARLIRAGWVVVIEFDDHPLLIAEMGGRSAPETEMARFGFPHAVQTTTPALVEAFSAYNPEVAMFPNAAFSLPPFIEGERPRRVFYGAVRRGPFAAEVAASLGPAIERWPDTRFEVVGDEAVFRALPTRSKAFHPYMTFEAYSALMSQCSISLSPIQALPRRESKSDAKYVDAAAAGALTIASPTIYDQVIEHGANGLIAPRLEDWAPLLTDALTDQAQRSRMARRAWQEVREGRMFAYQAPARRDWYLDLWARREALTRGVMQRLPGLREALGG